MFISYYSYFQKYKNKIFGLTGTLGTREHQKFLYDVYGAISIKLPRFIDECRTSMPPIVAGNEEEWLDAIVKDTHEIGMHAQRGVLIIVPTINMVEKISQALQISMYKGRIAEYFNGIKQAYIMKRIVRAGDVIIATNAAGRGADPKIARDVEKNGGLHVIMGTFPPSIQIYEQGIGRGCRNGECCSDRLIINAQMYPALNDNCDLKCLAKLRDEQAMQRLQHFSKFLLQPPSAVTL